MEIVHKLRQGIVTGTADNKSMGKGIGDGTCTCIGSGTGTSVGARDLDYCLIVDGLVKF